MQLTLDHTTQTADNIKTFWFKPSGALQYTAGQFVELTLDHTNPDDRGCKRWFTLSSSPTEDMIAITTKYNAQRSSSFKQHLFNIQLGDTLTSSQPMGDFVLPKDPNTPLVFIAGGIGITPMRSMVKWLTDTQQNRSIKLIYALNNLKELAFKDIFSTYGIDAIVVPSDPPKGWSGPSGRLNANTIMQLSSVQGDDCLYYVSGPEQMVEGLYNELVASGVNKHNIVGDYFPNYQTI